jgi:hypothetical protein
VQEVLAQEHTAPKKRLEVPPHRNGEGFRVGAKHAQNATFCLNLTAMHGNAPRIYRILFVLKTASFVGAEYIPPKIRAN